VRLEAAVEDHIHWSRVIFMAAKCGPSALLCAPTRTNHTLLVLLRRGSTSTGENEAGVLPRRLFCGEGRGVRQAVDHH
jgi:hypothetical protein